MLCKVFIYQAKMEFLEKLIFVSFIGIGGGEEDGGGGHPLIARVLQDSESYRGI